MRLEITYTCREATDTVAIRADVSAEAVSQAVERLQRWASDHGLQPASEPFFRLHSTLSGVVHLPVEGLTSATPADDGLAADRTVGGAVVVAAEVAFEDLRAVARSLQYELGALIRLTGPVEFHMAGEGVSAGALHLPVERHPEDGPRIVVL